MLAGPTGLALQLKTIPSERLAPSSLWRAGPLEQTMCLPPLQVLSNQYLKHLIS